MTDTVVTVEQDQPVGAVEPQVDILVDRQDAPVVIDTAVTQVVTQEAQTSIVVPRPEIHIVAVGQAGPPGGGSSDHGALTGLADDDHAQYHNDARGDLRYDVIGAAAAAVSAHEAAADPHPGYLTPAEGNAAYDAIGAAATVQSNLNTHKTSADHDGRYYTEAEIDALIDQAVKIASSPTFAGLTTTGDLQVDGNTTLGDASGDTLTINAGAWTYGSNFTVTRAAGALAAGTVDLGVFAATYTADAGGTTIARPWHFEATAQGANDFLRTNALTQTLEHAGTGTVGAARSINNILRLSSSGDVTLARGVESVINITGSGSVAKADMFLSQAPDLSGTGTINELNGFRAINLGNSLVTDAAAFRCLDMSGSITMSGFVGELTAGPGKKNLNITGTAENYLAGDLTCDANVTLGNASADTLTINAGTWTIGANYESTRAAGALAAGTTSLSDTRFTFSGDSGGTSTSISCNHNVTGSGANAMVTSTGHRFFQAWDGTATLSNLIGFQSVARAINTGNVTSIAGYRSEIELTSSGSTTTATHYRAVAPSLTSSGTITTVNGMLVSNQGNANVTTANGILIQDFTNSTTMSAAVLELSAGSGKKNLNITGTADNALAGPLYLAQDDKTQQTAAAIYAGTGAPNNANGNNGDFYFRGDGTVAGNNVMYHKEAGAWVAFTTT